MTTRSLSGELVVGIVGPIGSGVSTLAKFLSERGFQRLKLSDPIKDVYREREDIPAETPISEKTHKGSRKALQDIGDEGRKESETCWVEKILEGVESGNDKVIEGIRNLAEVEILREKFHRFFLVSMHASRATRWGRIRDVYDGSEKSFDTDDRRDQGSGESFGQQVGKCVQEADYVCNNEETLRAAALSNRLEENLLPDLELMRSVSSRRPRSGLRPPTEVEGHMAAAYAESHISRCIKRHVGAVIVGPDARPLSMGYNENPFAMSPCVTQFNKTCFKDEDMHDKLSKMEGVYCPSCGELCEVLQVARTVHSLISGPAFDSRTSPG